LIRILIIVPAYQEEVNIVRVVKSIYDARQQIADAELDVCVVNDGSKDNTGPAAESTGAIVLHIPYNIGIGGAVQAGFQYAYKNHYDIAIQIDGDGQHDPQFIPSLVRPIVEDNFDLTIGSRFLENLRTGFQSTFARRIGIKIFYWVNSFLIGQKITDNTSGFRAFGKRAIALLAENYPSDYPEPETVIILGLRKFRITEVPVVMRERQGGQSSIRPIASIYYMTKVLLSIFVNIFKKKL
jgi:glycosyltransferase involved in cell wall biosynthesis